LKTTKKTGQWNPARIFDALGRIGYTPVSALLDMCDNSVSAESNSIDISVNLIQSTLSDSNRKKAIIESFVISDNGQGMDESELDNALTFGSSENFYAAGTLSKFGLGLKSAASSLGKRLEIISRSKDGVTRVAILDRDNLDQKYEYEVGKADPEMQALLNKHVGSTSATGTVIRISKVRQESMISPTEITDGLRKKAGVIFYYHLAEKIDGKKAIKISIDGQPVPGVDPLFRNEVSKSAGDLDEQNWDGISVKWILKPQNIQLDTLGKCIARVSVVQLPHPPSVAADGRMTQSACREKYMIGAGNYGVFIYRNGRLISWADGLDGMITQDQDLYSFRGCLEINSDADDILNLDVTKSRIHLSEIARSQITAKIQEAKKKSRDAWNTAKTAIARKTGEAPRDAINEQLNNFGTTTESDEELDTKVAPPEEKKEIQRRKKALIDSTPATQEETRKLRDSSERVQYVDALDNNQLWQKVLTADGELMVRVNQSHRLYREVIDIIRDNSQLEMVLDVILFSLARAEYRLAYQSDFESKVIDKMMMEYRELVGDELSRILKKIDVSVITNGA
jgi:hypothetical protein